MNFEKFKAEFPEIDVEGLLPNFPRMSLSDYPELREYSWQECHRDFMGAGGLFLVSEMAQKIDIKPGMRVLDLCCGNCTSSIFMAKNYDVNVVAADISVDPTRNWARVKEAGLTQKVLPVRMDAKNLQFPDEHFDAVFYINSYFYFGTDDEYLPYLVQFLRDGGRIGIASPCYAHELKPDTPQVFLYDAPDYIESYAVHSPGWWLDHFVKSGVVDTLICQEHPKGREFWLDDVRWLLESCHPRGMEPKMRDMVWQQIEMLLTDQERFVTYLTIVAEKNRL